MEINRILLDKGTDIKDVLSVSISKVWTAKEFSTFFKSFDDLFRVNNKIYWIDYISKNPDKIEWFKKFEWHYLELTLDNFADVEVNSINYNSPGKIEIIGLSEILGQIKEILFYYFPNKKAKIESEILLQERNRKYIENLRSIGVEETDIRKLLFPEEFALSDLKKLITEGKITNIEMLKPKN